MQCRVKLIARAILLAWLLPSMHGLAAPPKGDANVPAGIPGTEIKLGGAIESLRTGGAGRYLIFRLRDSDKLVVVDAVAGKILNPIPTPGDFQFAADRDSLFLLLNGQRVVQRWNLKTQEREKTVMLTDDRPVKIAVMGDAGVGPLAIWFGDKVTFLDASSPEPMRFKWEITSVTPDQPTATNSGTIELKLTDEAGKSETAEIVLRDGTQLTATLSDDRVYPLKNTLVFQRLPSRSGRRGGN